MGFVFSLAAVLTVRRQREEMEERRLGAVALEHARAKQNLERIRGELASASAQRAVARPELVQGTSIHERYARVVLLQQALIELERVVAEIGMRRDAQQRIYVAARRDRELLEELEERQRLLFYADATRREQRRHDDLYLARRLRG